MNNVKIIVTSEVSSTPRKDEDGLNHWQQCAVATGRAFPAPFLHWIESPAKAVPAGDYAVLPEDLVVKNNDLVIDKRAVFRRGRVVASAVPPVRKAG